MTTQREPLAAFDSELLAESVESFALTDSKLEQLLRRHQEGVRELPGVDNIVYEWRTQFHDEPLLHRDEDVYVLALQDHVWGEFADYLGLADIEIDAIQSAHERQAQRFDGIDETVFNRRDAMVLTRP